MEVFSAPTIWFGLKYKPLNIWFLPLKVNNFKFILKMQNILSPSDMVGCVAPIQNYFTQTSIKIQWLHNIWSIHFDIFSNTISNDCKWHQLLSKLYLVIILCRWKWIYYFCINRLPLQWTNQLKTNCWSVNNIYLKIASSERQYLTRLEA